MCVIGTNGIEIIIILIMKYPQNAIWSFSMEMNRNSLINTHRHTQTHAIEEKTTMIQIRASGGSSIIDTSQCDYFPLWIMA